MCSREICYTKSINIGYVFQAKDKAHWQKLFSHFCSRTANEEDEIAHKLLGEQFRVSYHHVISAGNMKLLSCKMYQVQRLYCALTVISIIYRSISKAWQCHSPLIHVKLPLRPPVFMMYVFCYAPFYRGSWPCYTAFSQQHCMMIISAG